jgi:hypothetical protein
MTLRIDYQSQSFPVPYNLGSSTFKTSWNELLWAAITIGRPSTYHVFRYGSPSFHEASQLREEFSSERYQPDGLRVTAGDSWSQPFGSLQRG